MPATRLFGRLGAATVFLLVAPGFATAADVAPLPQALYPRFNLEYLPKVGGQGIVGIRPAEIARHATAAEVEQASTLVFGVFSQLLGGNPVDGPSWPTFADIDQCVCCLEMRVIAPSAVDERGTFLLGGKTPGLVRTVRPFDWEGLLRKSLPHVATARHAGRTYLRIPNVMQMPVPFLGRFGEPIGVLIPDDRTLVIGAESDIRAVLDRRARGRLSPEPLPGWSEVDRDLIALAFDNRQVPLVSGRFPAGYKAAKELEALAGSLQTLAVGLSTSHRTRVRIVAVAKDGIGAGLAAAAIRGLFAQALESSADEKDTDVLAMFGMDLLKSAAIEVRGRKLTGTLAAEGNVVKLLFALLRGPV